MRFVESVLTSEGAGAEVQRLFPIRAGRMNHDPFVLWDHFLLEKGMGFPTHPHRGFEAITYIFEGSMEHKDNLGNHSRVYAKGAQRFTAGSGLEHSEMPDESQRTTGIDIGSDVICVCSGTCSGGSGDGNNTKSIVGRVSVFCGPVVDRSFQESCIGGGINCC